MDFEKLLLEKNLGGLDRAVRIAVGLVFAVLVPGQENETVKILFGLIAFVGLVTGIVGHCTLYSVLGWSTRKK
ncbi:Uncharacterised protein [Candidatus Burarchaeum australiense]|nr:Uncharacterised protein [Candidatus Burarchaeum australiense]